MVPGVHRRGRSGAPHRRRARRPVRTEHRYPWTEPYEAPTYIDLVRSLVEHERLPTERLDRLVEAIAQIIKAAGGTIDVSYQTRLYLTPAIAP
jgi:hypothetical protein